MDVEQRARELLARCLDEWGHPCEAENIREGEDLESYESELRLISQLLRFGMDTADELGCAALTPPEGHVVVTRNEAGQAVAVTRQDDEGRILSVIAEFEGKWQPIESAPRDGRWILLGKPGHDEVLLAYWDRLRGAWWGQGGGDGQWKKWQDATSWQPLPAAPEVPDGRC